MPHDSRGHTQLLRSVHVCAYHYFVRRHAHCESAKFAPTPLLVLLRGVWLIDSPKQKCDMVDLSRNSQFVRHWHYCICSSLQYREGN